jgi:retron-type reverse transcriptase
MKENSENGRSKQTKQTKLESRELCQIMPSDAARPWVIL